MNNALVVSSNLSKSRIDLNNANEALTAYWGRGSSDLDYRIADVHMAAEALMRAIASVSLAVERLAEVPACEGVN